MKNANPVSLSGVASLTLAISMFGCQRSAPEVPLRSSVPALPAETGTNSGIARYAYEVVKTWPHDRAAFTQGLVFREGNLIESTGLNGQSSLREVELATGRVLKQVTLAPEYFAEGAAVIGGRVFQLTWQNQTGFIYDVDTFQRHGEFKYAGEGWGLATDGTLLILSDGTSRIRFLDAVNFEVKRSIEVTREGKPLGLLNELEFIRGEIFANVWQTDEVVRIDPTTGQVRGVISFAGLLPSHERRPDTDVLNGIAYDEKSDRLFVTGKRWPRVYEVRLKAL